MPSYLIPQEEWRRALDAFSLAHFAWPVSVEIVSPSLDTQPTVLELPLDAISVSGTGAHTTVAISMSRERPAHVTQMIERVADVLVRRDGDVDSAIEFVASDGTRTILRFTPPTNRIVSTTVH